MNQHMSKASLLKILQAQGIQHPDVLKAFQTVPREQFVQKDDLARAYENRALPIDCQQTISQPYIVALMTQALLSEGPCKKVLEIGTGSGYQTAILSQLVNEVYTIERIESLQMHAKKILAALHYDNIHYLYSDGADGWPEFAPFDGIIITAAAEKIPQKLIEQLSPNGVLVAPIGNEQSQSLLKCTFKGDELVAETIEEVKFVPLLPGTKDD